MAIRPTLGWNNRLVRRVMRHRSVTTLFPTAPTGTMWPTGTASRATPGDQGATADTGYIAVVINPVATTELLSAGPTTVTAALPEVRVARNPAATPVRTPQNEPARVTQSSGPAPAVRALPSGAAGRAAALLVPQPDQAQRTQALEVQTSEPSIPTVNDEGDTTLTDQVWHRLQTIFRRHQAPELAESEPEALAEPGAVAELEAAPEAEAPPPAALASGSAPEVRGTGETPSAPAATSAATGTSRGPVQRMPDIAIAAQTTRVTDRTAAVSALATALPSVEVPQNSAARQSRRPLITETEHTAEPPTTDLEAGSPPETDGGPQSVPPATPVPPLTALDRSAEPSALPADQHIDRAASAAAGAAAPPAAAEPLQIAPGGSTEPGGPAEPGGSTGPQAPFEARPTPQPASIEHGTAPAQPVSAEQVEGRAYAAPAQPRVQPVTVIQIPVPEATAPEITASPAVIPQSSPALQEVWAVQKMPVPVRSESSPATVPALNRDRRIPLTAPEPIPDQIATVLDRVPAGRRTQSTIEMIPPRRPRPVPAQQPATTLVAETEALAEPALPAQETAQPAMPSAPTTAAPQTLPTRMPASEPPAPEVIIVPSPETPSAIPTTAPRIVETGIGALPADLWELIGETPPISQGMPRNVPVKPRAPTTEPARVQPSGPGSMLQRSAISTTAQAPASATATERGGPVQTRVRQAPASEAASSAAAASEAGAAAETEASGEPEVDVDKLARRVYAEIKRRLTIEWERIRRY